MKEYICSAFNTKIKFNPCSSRYTVESNGGTWVNTGRKPYIILRKKVGKKYIYTYRPFSLAGEKIHKVTENAIESRYSGFFAFGKKYDFTLVCTAKITGEGKAEFSVRAENETGMDIHAVAYPAPFNALNPDRNAYTVDTMRQGVLIPDGWKQNRLSLFLITKYWRKVNTGDFYMPFWGRVSGKKGFLSIIDTPYDSTIFSANGKNKAILNGVNWMSSLGKLSYERRIKMEFYADCDYNTICKGYRNYLIEKGELVTIDEKIEKNPNVKKLIDTPVLHTSIYTTIHPKSNYYDKKHPEKNQTLFATFDQRAEEYAKYKDMGLERLYIHTDGWGEMGYDNNHPYVLPPCPQAGGFEGMKRLCDKCDDLQYVFGIHDQYRDFYYSCKKFDMNLAVENIDGGHPYCSIWFGGPHTWLCAANAKKFLETTHKELEEHGIFIKGAYLDVFSIMWGDECFNREHPATREESIKYRGECFDYLRGKGIIASSEEPGSQMINYLDLVHHAPYAVRPQEKGVAVGVPTPFLNLVYHDCVFVPWCVDGIGGWGIPDGDAGFLHCILNAQTPYFGPYDEDGKVLSDEELKKRIAKVKEACAVQKRLYNKEMVSHKFLDENRRKQETRYSDGTVITVDFDKNTYNVSYGE